MSEIITRFYPSMDEARVVVQDLEDAGFRHNDVSVLARAPHTADADETTEDLNHIHDKANDAGAGAVMGSLLGGGTGLLAGLGALAIPGLGPLLAAGWLISTVSIAGVGAIFGAAAGSMGDDGVHPDDLAAYQARLHQGEVLVVVRAADDRLDVARALLDHPVVGPTTDTEVKFAPVTSHTSSVITQIEDRPARVVTDANGGVAADHPAAASVASAYTSEASPIGSTIPRRL